MNMSEFPQIARQINSEYIIHVTKTNTLTTQLSSFIYLQFVCNDVLSSPMLIKYNLIRCHMC